VKKKKGAIDHIWLVLLVSGTLYGVLTGQSETVSSAASEYAGKAVQLIIGLVGTMSLWMGVMKIAEKSGLMEKLASLLRPVMKRLFPGIPEGHAALGAMAMNMAANMLGLGNAATPFGLKAMKELDSLNREKGTATHDMILFLCMNTASVTLLPTGVMSLRAAADSSDPGAVIGPTLIASVASALFGVIVCTAIRKSLKRR
jgi:spore maturation protein A